jgi:hypothetical protein
VLRLAKGNVFCLRAFASQESTRAKQAPTSVPGPSQDHALWSLLVKQDTHGILVVIFEERARESPELLARFSDVRSGCVQVVSYPAGRPALGFRRVLDVSIRLSPGVKWLRCV